MPLVPTCSRGFALPLALSCSAVLLLSSLSLQTIALHGRPRSHQALLVAQRSDLHHSAAMDFQQRVQGANACLLRHAASAWDHPSLCPEADPRRLRQGRFGEMGWSLLDWPPSSPRSGQLRLRMDDGQEAQLSLKIS